MHGDLNVKFNNTSPPPFYGTRSFTTTLQELTTCPSHELDQSSPCSPPPIILLRVHLNIILPSMLGFHTYSPSLRFHHQNLYGPLLSLVRATCSAHLILFTVITRIIYVEKYRSLRDHPSLSLLFIVTRCPVFCYTWFVGGRA